MVSLLIKDFCCSKKELVRVKWENKKTPPKSPIPFIYSYRYSTIRDIREFEFRDI
jgi:hypothetical protein